MARKKAEFPIGTQTVNRYLRYPDEHWQPLTRSDILKRGMVVRKTADPKNPETLFYILTDQPNSHGMYSLRRVNGTREIDLLAPRIQNEYSHYVGTPSEKSTDSTEGGQKTTKNPEETERAKVIVEQRELQEEMKRAPPGGLHVKGAGTLLEKIKSGESTRPADPASTGHVAQPSPSQPPKPRGRPRKEPPTRPPTPPTPSKEPDAETIRKVAEFGEKISGKIPKSVNEKKVKEEEERLLTAACAALVLGSGSVPDAKACEETFKETINRLANAVALRELTHDDAIKQIVQVIKAALDEKGSDAFSSKEAAKAEKRIDKIEGSVTILSQKLDQMNNQMRQVLLRWEQISPILPTSHVQYYLKDRKKKGGKVGMTSYHTGRVESVDTEKSLDEMDETLVLYVKSGLCFHFNEKDAPMFHELYARTLNKEPENVYGYDAETGDINYEESSLPGYTYSLCVDLTRRKTEDPYMAAGGRIQHPRAWVKNVEKSLPGVKIEITDDAELA
jgi:hypothetical protein